jgi:shikimate kinase
VGGFGEAISYGAATVINAIATGSGGALGVNLWTRARVLLTNNPNMVFGRILSEPNEDISLIREAVRVVLRHFGLEKKYGAYVETESNIPIARGLKSSSAAANAIVLATVAALGEDLPDIDVINLGVDAAIAAKTTITGAFDDASASYLGGLIVANNFQRKILKRFNIDEELEVLFYVPSKKVYTYSSDVARMKLMAPYIQIAFNEALDGNYWAALTINGLIYSCALGYDPKPAIEALQAGAIASGLSGKGPSTSAIVARDKVNDVIRAWSSLDGDIIRARVNNEKARVTRREEN